MTSAAGMRELPPPRAVLVTGFPGVLARKLVEELVGRGEHVFVAVDERCCNDAAAACARAEAIGERGLGTVQAAIGRITAPDLGLPGPTALDWIRRVRVVHHAMEEPDWDAPARRLWAIHVNGLRSAAEYALEMPHLELFVLHSTALVSGCRRGLVLEDELDKGQRFHNEWERTRFEAERLARRIMRQLPLAVVRAGLLAGDAQSGELDAGCAVHRLLRLFVDWPPELPLPIPGPGHGTLPLTPADYVARAAVEIAARPDAVGHTFHVVDPHPMATWDVFRIVSGLAGRRPPRPVHGTGPLTRHLLELPIVRRRLATPRLLHGYLGLQVRYSTVHADRILRTTSVQCPPFPTYAPRLVGRVLGEPPAAGRSAATPEPSRRFPLGPRARPRRERAD